MEKETAMKILKELHDKSLFAERTALETIIPELKKSEDEKIREELLEFLENVFYLGKNAHFDRWEKSDCSKWITWLKKQGEPQDKGEISDGYHTFNELYYYRMLYNAAFFNMLPKEWVHKSKRHNDGEECFGGGWFIVMANLPTGQISNHYELKDWDLFQIPEKEVADKWDGHTPQEAADRLHKYLLEKQGGQKSIINIAYMVSEYASTPEQGNEGFGKPMNCMVRAYRQGILDTLKKIKQNNVAEEQQNITECEPQKFGSEGKDITDKHQWEDGDIIRLKKDDGVRWQIFKSSESEMLEGWFMSQIMENGIAGGYVNSFILDAKYEFLHNPCKEFLKKC